MTVQELERISKKVREAERLRGKIDAAETLINVLTDYLVDNESPQSLIKNIREFILDKRKYAGDFFESEAAFRLLGEFDIKEKETAIIKQLIAEVKAKRAEYESKFEEYKIWEAI